MPFQRHLDRFVPRRQAAKEESSQQTKQQSQTVSVGIKLLLGEM